MRKGLKGVEKTFKLHVQEAWCKGCGICVGFCRKQVLSIAVNGKLSVDHPENCVGCGQCQLRCPDFAIEVEEITK